MNLGVIAASGALAMVVGSSAAFAAPPPPPRLPAPPTVRASQALPLLHRQDDGSLRHVNTEGRFVGTIHPDGRVELRDLPGTEVELRTPFRVTTWLVGMAQAIGNDERHDRPELETPMPDREDTRARLEAATEKIDYGPYGPPPILVGLSMGFGGIADLALRRGQRKQARAKEQFLERTAPLREALARRHTREQQRAALLSLGRQLAALWRDESRSVAERKRALFERWDDCEEARASDSEVDRERMEGAEQMRLRIERFVRRVVPETSTMAFTPEELQRLNAHRRSRRRFDPYAIRPEPNDEHATTEPVVAR